VSLDSWRDSRLIVEHESSKREISELREIICTDLEDARISDLSPDRRLSCCYGALLTAARAALRASGYREPKGTPSPSLLRDSVAPLHGRPRHTDAPEDREHREEASDR